MATAFLPNKLLTLKNKRSKAVSEMDSLVFGQKMGLVAKLFGCWHKTLVVHLQRGKPPTVFVYNAELESSLTSKLWKQRGVFTFRP